MTFDVNIIILQTTLYDEEYLHCHHDKAFMLIIQLGIVKHRFQYHHHLLQESSSKEVLEKQ